MILTIYFKQIPENRVRHETAVRNTGHAPVALEERHRASRLRLSSDFVNHAETSAASSPHVPNFDNSDSNSSCNTGDSSVHNRMKPPSPEILDISIPLDSKQPCVAKSVLPDAQSHLVKRRHGRMSPLAQPYSRNKTNRGAVVVPENTNSASSSTAAAPFCHPASRRHHVSWDEQSPVSPPMSNASSTSLSRSSRRRQRPRSDGKESLDVHNSDDEHDDLRLQRLNQGIDYEEVILIKQRISIFCNVMKCLLLCS